MLSILKFVQVLCPYPQIILLHNSVSASVRSVYSSLRTKNGWRMPNYTHMQVIFNNKTAFQHVNGDYEIDNRFNTPLVSIPLSPADFLASSKKDLCTLHKWRKDMSIYASLSSLLPHLRNSPQVVNCIWVYESQNNPKNATLPSKFKIYSRLCLWM